MPEDELLRECERWRSMPRRRPAGIVPPGPGQESVWDYPRPPALAPAARPVRVEAAGEVIARSRTAQRVMETASPPVYYVAPADVRMDLLRISTAARTLCEWKGMAEYLDLHLGDRRFVQVAWRYPAPLPGFEGIRDWVAFFPGRVDGCFLGDVRVEAQPGAYYGGWVTPEIVGPFKGEPGTEEW